MKDVVALTMLLICALGCQERKSEGHIEQSVPFANMLSSVASSHVGQFKSCFAESIREDEEQGHWEENVERAKDALSRTFGEMKRSDFKYQFDPETTRLGIEYRGQSVVWISVIEEKGAWKLNAAMLEGDYFLEMPAVVESAAMQIVTPPFDGHLLTVQGKTGDKVKANETVLAVMDTTELQMELARVRAERAVALKEYAMAMRDGSAEAQVHQAHADSIQTQIDRLQWLASQARIVSPIDGAILSRDPNVLAGAAVPRSQTLFLLGSTEALCVTALVSPDDVVKFKMALDRAHAAPGELEGELALNGHPNGPIPVVFESLDLSRASAMAVARLDGVRPELAPGMRGTVRVPCGRRCAYLFGAKESGWSI